MKRILLASTALTVGGAMALCLSSTEAAAQQKGLKLGVGGYFQAYYVFADQDLDSTGEPAANRRSNDLKREGEIHFLGRVTLDNGLTVGADVQLEAEVSSDQIDESYLYFQGNFGRVILGSENSAAYLLSVGARPVDSSFDGADPNYRLFQTGGNRAVGGGPQGGFAPGVAYVTNMTSDSEKVTYLSPRFAGFQAGISFTGENGEEANTSKTGTFAGMPTENDPGQWKDIVELGLNYEGNFGPVAILAAVTGGFGSLESSAGLSNADDRQNFSAGLDLRFSGFDISGGYYVDDLGTKSNGDRTAYVFGLGYSFGPFRIGATYTNFDQEAGTLGAANSGVGSDTYERWMFGGSYNYAPGMQLRASVAINDLDGPDVGPVSQTGVASRYGTANDPRNDNVIFAIGTVVSF